MNVTVIQTLSITLKYKLSNCTHSFACKIIPVVVVTMNVCVCRYEMIYRQAVSSEDMFLQLGNKTPMTSSCEELVVR